MEDMIPCAVKDQEVFQRVWQRVMAGRSEDASPIQPGIPGGWEGDVPCECLEALMRQNGGGLPPECGDQGTTTEPETPQPSEGQGCSSQESEVPMEPEPSLQEPVEAPGGWEPAEETPAPEPSAPEEPCECGGTEGLPEEDGPDRGNDLPGCGRNPSPPTTAPPASAATSWTRWRAGSSTGTCPSGPGGRTRGP